MRKVKILCWSSDMHKKELAACEKFVVVYHVQSLWQNLMPREQVGLIIGMWQFPFHDISLRRKINKNKVIDSRYYRPLSS